jgi:hypothetical protein
LFGFSRGYGEPDGRRVSEGDVVYAFPGNRDAADRRRIALKDGESSSLDA